MSETKSLAARMCAVMSDVGQIKKDKRLNGGGNYEYLSEEAVVGALQGLCAKHGIAVIPISWEILENREGRTGSGNTMVYTRLLGTYQFVNADDSSDIIVAQAIGEGSDTGDKVCNKCQTAAFKYLLRQTFMISTGDDPDHTASVETKQTQQKAAQRQQPAPGNGQSPVCKKIHAMAAEAFGRGEDSKSEFAALKAQLFGETPIKTTELNAEQANALIDALSAIIDSKNKETPQQ